MARFRDIAKKLELRINHGDYRLRGFPSHSELVSEFEANSRTITKSLQLLVDKDLLARTPTGRVELADTGGQATLHLGLVVPAYPSPFVFYWFTLIEPLASSRDWTIKLLPYTHWHDSTIAEAMSGLNGVFFLPQGDDIPNDVIEQLKNGEAPAVVLEEDVSNTGLPCLRSLNPSGIERLLEHLHELGHEEIPCLNSQPVANVIRERISYWQLWKAAHGTSGDLVDEPVPIKESAIEGAYATMQRLFREGFNAQAIFCTTGAAALGVMRAAHEAGKRIGEDFAVCAADDTVGTGEYLVPSLTCLQLPKLDPYVQVCLDWFERGGQEWIGPMMLQPSALPLFIGESSCPPQTNGRNSTPSRQKKRRGSAKTAAAK